MSEPAPAHPAADRNLLFGIVALQLDFISRDQLITAMNAWVLDKHKPLGQVLVEQQALPAERRVHVRRVAGQKQTPILHRLDHETAHPGHALLQNRTAFQRLSIAGRQARLQF